METIKITEEELKSLKNYLGPKQVAINCVGTSNVNEIMQAQKDGYKIAKNREEIEENIKDFVNVYSLIYKNSVLNPSEYGFSAKQRVSLIDANLLKEDTLTNKYISVATNLELIMDLEELEEESIVEILGDENIPFLDIKNFIKQYPKVFDKEIKKLTREDKLLLPPYIKAAKVNKSMSSLYKDYEVAVEKHEFIIEKNENEKDKNELTEDYEKYLEFIKEREELEKDPKADSKRKRWLTVRINAYTKKMSEVVRNMCAVREKEIQRDYKNELYSQKKQKIIENYSKIERNIIDSFESMIKISNEFNDLANEIKLDSPADLMKYDISKKVIAIRDNIKSQIANLEVNHSDESSKKALEVSERLKELANKYNKKTEENFKEELYIKVQGAIKVAKIWSLGNQLEMLEEENSNIFDKITGKEALKKEQIRSIKLQIQKEREAVIKKDNYSMKEMMTDIFYTSKHSLGGRFTPEMKELSDFIVKNYGVTVKYEGGKTEIKKYTQDIIDQLVLRKEEKEENENNNSNLPMVQEYSIFGNRKFAKQLKEQNDLFELTIKSSRKSKPVFLEDFRNRNATSEIYETLTIIDKLTRNDNDLNKHNDKDKEK